MPFVSSKLYLFHRWMITPCSTMLLLKRRPKMGSHGCYPCRNAYTTPRMNACPKNCVCCANPASNSPSKILRNGATTLTTLEQAFTKPIWNLNGEKTRRHCCLIGWETPPSIVLWGRSVTRWMLFWKERWLPTSTPQNLKRRRGGASVWGVVWAPRHLSQRTNVSATIWIFFTPIGHSLDKHGYVCKFKCCAQEHYHIK